MKLGLIILALVFAVLAQTRSLAQQTQSRNLQTCLSGKYPTLCNHSQLTPDQLRETRVAELRENLRTCLTGKYASLCNHTLLTSDQAKQVQEAERAENLRVCLTGRYSSLCKRNLLSPSEYIQVRRIEREENLKVCLDGRYSALCNHGMLTPEQAKDVSLAETRATSLRRQQPVSRSQARGVGRCDAVRTIASIEGSGKVIKLDDGSIWEVDDVDTVTTSVWVAPSEVTICNGKLINIDDGESVEVSPIDTHPRVRSSRPSVPAGYVIEASSNDETFVINGEVFKAQTFCSGFEKGDRVRFLSGSPLGACASATILNLSSGKTCKVWCE